jgi:hypothetical protein
MLKKAFSKLRLEHLVIGKGQFHLERSKPNSAEVLEVGHIHLNCSIYFVFHILVCESYIYLFLTSLAECASEWEDI